MNGVLTTAEMVKKITEITRAQLEKEMYDTYVFRAQSEKPKKTKYKLKYR